MAACAIVCWCLFRTLDKTTFAVSSLEIIIFGFVFWNWLIRMRLLALWRGKLGKLASTVDAFCAFDCLLIHALHIKKKLNAKAMVVCGMPQLSLKNGDPVSWRGSHAWIVVATTAGVEL
ncbi:hypothetical protein Tco_0135529 [Tanacetum coccineum]